MSDRDFLRIEELLIDRALGQLSREQDEELRALLSEHPKAAVDDYEWVAGETTAALLLDGALEDMPAGVASAVIERAGPHGGTADSTDISPDTGVAPARGVSRPPRSNRWVAVSGWLAAAAALAGWLTIPDRAAVPMAEPTLAQLRDSLVSSGAQVVQIPWTSTDDPASALASGDVVWSASLQTGFMRFAGLETNDPAVFQYQLWIFDATRDERYPVDGGVFDMLPGGEVIVRIDPRIEVRDASLFAITIEPPGGVVVSDRERIVLVAQTG